MSSFELRPRISQGVSSLRRHLNRRPSKKDRDSHNRHTGGVIATVIFALGPLGFGMIDPHPCGAWFLWTMSLLFGVYSFWSITPIARWGRAIVIIGASVSFFAYAYRSVRTNTELSFFFVNPGVFIVQGTTGRQMLAVTGENTHKPLLAVEMLFQDNAMAEAALKEPDTSKRISLMSGSIFQRTFPEINQYYTGDKILWTPLDVNNQRYTIQGRYRIGDIAYLDSEEIKIVNVGPRFQSASGEHGEVEKWQFSVTVKNQSGVVLMQCVDAHFPQGTPNVKPCFPGADYRPLARSICARCFGVGFEYFAK